MGKTYRLVALMIGAVALLEATAIASIIGRETAEVIFSAGKTSEGSEWSANFVLTEKGLTSTPKPSGNGWYSQEGWIRTGRIPAGLAWRPPTAVNVTLAINGRTSRSLPLEVYVRYGCDGIHWSTWYRMQEAEKTLPTALKTFQYALIIPHLEHEAYSKLMVDEWYATNPEWSSDEDAFCRWLTKKHPGFFNEHVPVIGYVQFLLEYDSWKEWNDFAQAHHLAAEEYALVSRQRPSEFTITSLSAQMLWGVGGLQTTPKSGKPDHENKWHFDMSKR